MHLSKLENYDALELAAVLASLSSTRSLCCRFLRWTSKFSTVVPGPGVYSLPGQSRQRMRGRYWYLSFWPGCVAFAFATGIMVAVSTAV